MEGESRSYPAFTPTMSVVPNNAHQTNAVNSQAGTHRMPVEVVEQSSKGSTANSAVSAATPTAATSSAYAIADIQMVDVQYGAVDTSHNTVSVAPPWPATSSTVSTKVTTQVPTFSGYPASKTHTVVVDVSKENDLGIPALMETGNFGQTPGESSGSKTPTLSYIDDSISGVMNLKKLFRTLQEFANKRSRSAGEKVTQLINNLVGGRISVEKFNEDIVLTTDYPIKDCLIPLIKDNLPTLQREFSQAQKVAASPVSSVQSNPMIVSLSGGQSKSQPIMAAPPPPYTQSEQQIMQQNNNTLLKRKRPRNLRDLNSLGEIVSPDVTVVSWQDAAKKPKPSVTSNETPVTSMPSASPLTSTSVQEEKHLVYPEEWRHVDQMMWCVIGMVEKTRQAINMLRNKHYSELETWKTAIRSGETSTITPSTASTTNIVRPTTNPNVDTSKAVEIAIAAVKHQAEIDRQKIMAQADQKCKEEIMKAKREMEERMLKAQRASHDIPLQDSSEIVCLSGNSSIATPTAAGSSGSTVLDIERQHIVEEAERRCRGELEQMRREIDTLKESLKDQVDSEDTCWNCGRVARDKCSGCGKAAYCGRFCQHKHWSRHQLKCLQLRGKGGGTNTYPPLGSQNPTRSAVVPSTHTSTHVTPMINASNDVIIIPSLQPTTNKSVHPGTGHYLVTSHPSVRLHQDVNHTPTMIVNNSPQPQPAQIQSPVATVIALDSSKSKPKLVTQDTVTISSPTQPPRLSTTDQVTSSSNNNNT